MNTLEVKQLTKRFDKKEVLRGVSFGVKKGQLLADNVAVMNAGALEQIGSPDEVYSTPKSLFAANFVGESNSISVKISGNNKVLMPWGEWDCNTKGREDGDAFLLFRPHQVKIETGGCCDGVIIDRGFVDEMYRYHISSSGEKIKLHDCERYEVGQPVRFSIEKMEVIVGWALPTI